MTARDRTRHDYATRRELAEAGEQEPDDDSAPGQRLEHRAVWVDLQVRAAMERGEFDDLPGSGKPIPGLDGTGTHDPDWWVKQLIEREQVTGVLPPALGLRTEDARLDHELDALATESRVREVVQDFNRRVVEARRQLLGGPPVITPTRDVDAEVHRWRVRREERLAAQRERNARSRDDAARPPRRRRFWRTRPAH